MNIFYEKISKDIKTNKKLLQEISKEENKVTIMITENMK